jgi:long-chain fatty acid transport protein
MRWIIGVLTLALALGGSASTFRSNGLGARARGMGGAYVAVADDTSAGFWNPAGLAAVPGLLAQAEGKFERIYTAYTPPGGTRQANRPLTLTVPAVGVAVPLHHPRWPAVEVLAYAPYGLQLDWDPAATYRYNSIGDRIRVISVGGATAYRLSDRVALGLAAFYDDAKLNFATAVPSAVYAGVPGLPDARLSADGTDTTGNVHLGLLWRTAPDVTVGAAWRSAIDLTVRGTAALAVPGGPTVRDTWSLPLRLPPSLSLGAAWQASPILLLAAQADWVGWSTIHEQNLTFDGALPDQRVARNWRDRVQLRLGAEYTALPVALRAGYSYDPTPVPVATLDPLLLDVDRHILALGAGTAGPRWGVDAAYEHFFGTPRTATSPFPGRYTGRVDILTVTVSYRQ